MLTQNKLKRPYECFGIECGDGWKPLYQPIIDYITLYNSEHEETDSHIYIDQIKEKFGGLRFHWSGENLDQETCDTLSNMVREAEAKSYRVCEICGTHEDVGITVDGWYTTLCGKCTEKTITNSSWRQFRRWKCNDDGKIYIIDKDGKHEHVK